MRVFYFDRYIFRISFPLALHIKMYTASRDFLATARLLQSSSYRRLQQMGHVKCHDVSIAHSDVRNRF